MLWRNWKDSSIQCAKPLQLRVSIDGLLYFTDIWSASGCTKASVHVA
jgi:hypothetical protein